MAKSKRGRMNEGRPTDYSPALLDSAREYRDMKHETVPSLAGLAIHLGLSRETVHTWIKDENKKEFSDICQVILTLQESGLLHGGLSNKFNPTITKLMLSKHGYHDKQETDITSGGVKIEPLTVRFIEANGNSNTTGVQETV